MGDFFGKEPEGFFANDFGYPRMGILIGIVILVVKRTSFGKKFGNGFEKVLHSRSADARKRDRAFFRASLFGNVPLRKNADEGFFARFDQFVDLPFFGAVRSGRVDETNCRVGIGKGPGSDGIDPDVEFVFRFMNSGRVKKNDLPNFVGIYSSYRFSRGLRTTRNDRDLLVDKRVQEARFS